MFSRPRIASSIITVSEQLVISALVPSIQLWVLRLRASEFVRLAAVSILNIKLLLLTKIIKNINRVLPSLIQPFRIDLRCQ